jgi:hypothetical protein
MEIILMVSDEIDGFYFAVQINNALLMIGPPANTIFKKS